MGLAENLQQEREREEERERERKTFIMGYLEMAGKIFILFVAHIKI